MRSAFYKSPIKQILTSIKMNTPVSQLINPTLV
jgi:hypothetical protein